MLKLDTIWWKKKTLAPSKSTDQKMVLLCWLKSCGTGRFSWCTDLCLICINKFWGSAPIVILLINSRVPEVLLTQDLCHGLSTPHPPPPPSLDLVIIMMASSPDLKGSYWAIQWSRFARVNALCNLLCKKLREVAAHFLADFWVGVASRCV